MFPITKSVEGVLPLFTGCQMENELSGADRTLGTDAPGAGDVSTHIHYAAKIASMTKMGHRSDSCWPPLRKFTTC